MHTHHKKTKNFRRASSLAKFLVLNTASMMSLLLHQKNLLCFFVLSLSMILFGTSCEKRDVSTLSKSIVGVWRVSPDDDFCLYYDAKTLTQIQKKENGEIVKTVHQYNVISHSESENSIILGIYEKDDDDYRHRRKIKFTNLDRDSFIEEIKLEKPLMGLDLGWVEGSRYHYEGSGPP